MSWAARHSVRVVSRTKANEAIAAARDMNAELLVLHCRLIGNDAAQLEMALMRAQFSGAVLCVGAPAHRGAFLSHGADAYVSERATLDEVLTHATRMLDTQEQRDASDSGLRRPARSVLNMGSMVIDLLGRRVFVNHHLIRLRPAEFEVLVYLALNRHRTVSAPEIVRDALDTCGDGSSARNQLCELRRKLREAGLVNAIETERGRGYRLVL